MRARRRLRVALAHDWLTGMRGGEAVLERLCRRYPGAPLYTLFHQPGTASAIIAARPIITSDLDRLALARRRYRHLLPLYPAAVERFGILDVDLLVSTSHCAIKGLRVPPGAQHVSYVHTPMRYVYDQYHHYFGPGRAAPGIVLAMRALRPYLQAWDRRSAARPTELLANSAHVRARIERHWGRDAAVIYPPVQLERFAPVAAPSRDYYLMLGAFAPYKRVDLAIAACTALDLPLWIAGDGQDAARLRRSAGPRIRFLGRVDDAEVPQLYANARALLFPGEEDFGITPVEAQASGTPVIALGRGGALETVRGLDHHAPTGLFFPRQREVDLIDALRRFEAGRDQLQLEHLRDNAARFAAPRFDAAMATVLDAAEKRAEARLYEP